MINGNFYELKNTLFADPSFINYYYLCAVCRPQSIKTKLAIKLQQIGLKFPEIFSLPH